MLSDCSSNKVKSETEGSFSDQPRRAFKATRAKVVFEGGKNTQPMVTVHVMKEDSEALIGTAVNETSV